MNHNGGAKYSKVTLVTGTTVDFTSSFAYTASNNDIASTTSSFGAGLIVSGALHAGTKITIDGIDIPVSTFSVGSFYEVAVEKVVAHGTDYIYVFQR